MIVNLEDVIANLAQRKVRLETPLDEMEFFFKDEQVTINPDNCEFLKDIKSEIPSVKKKKWVKSDRTQDTWLGMSRSMNQKVTTNLDYMIYLHTLVNPSLF